MKSLAESPVKVFGVLVVVAALVVLMFGLLSTAADEVARVREALMP
jgi:hypothetical protein